MTGRARGLGLGLVLAIGLGLGLVLAIGLGLGLWLGLGVGLGVVKSLIRHSLFQPALSILRGPQFYKGPNLPLKWGRGAPIKFHDTGNSALRRSRTLKSYKFNRRS